MKTHLFAPNIILIFSVAILCSIISCKKESRIPEPAELHFAAEGLEYVQLKQGMYLVYKDSASGQEDSITVKTSLLENNYSPETTSSILGVPVRYPPYYYQVFTLILSEANNNANTWFFGKADGSFPFPVGASNSSSIISIRDINGSRVFQFPVDNFSTFYIVDMNVEGTVYTNVVKSFWTNTYDETDPLRKSETLYWAKGAGIIKWQKTNGSDVQTFTLLRHG